MGRGRGVRWAVWGLALCLAVGAFAPPVLAYSQGPQSGVPGEGGTVPGASGASGVEGAGAAGDMCFGELWSQFQVDGGSILSRAIAWTIDGIAGALMRIAGLRCIEDLIFYAPAGEHYGVFTDGQWEEILTWYRWLEGVVLSVAVFTLLFVLGGLRLMTASARARVEVWETVLRGATAVVIVVMGPELVNLLLSLNSAFVESVRGALASTAVTPDVVGQGAGDPILTAVVHVAMAVLTLFFNLLYVVRAFMIAAMLVLLPLTAWSYLRNGNFSPFDLCLSELVSNVFRQSAQALVFAFYVILTRPSVLPEGFAHSWMWQLFMLVLIVPVSELVTRMLTGWLEILGMKEAQVAGLAALGLGSLVGVAHALGGGGARLGGGAAAALAASAGGSAGGPGGGPAGGGGGAGGVETGANRLGLALGRVGEAVGLRPLSGAGVLHPGGHRAAGIIQAAGHGAAAIGSRLGQAGFGLAFGVAGAAAGVGGQLIPVGRSLGHHVGAHPARKLGHVAGGLHALATSSWSGAGARRHVAGTLAGMAVGPQAARMVFSRPGEAAQVAPEGADELPTSAPLGQLVEIARQRAEAAGELFRVRPLDDPAIAP